MRIVVQAEPFDFGAEAQAFASGHQDQGAVVTFTGIVRNNAEGTLERMVIEHYPGMTEKALTKIAQEALQRWNLGDALVIHRHGGLKRGAVIVIVATASRHRKHAFEAAEFLMDYLKSRAPFWKKEFLTDSADWVAAKDEDEESLSRWD